MHITDLEVFEVAVPFRAPILSAFGVSYPARIRTFLRVHTDVGLVGHGEAGPSATHPYARGSMPHRVETIVKPAIVGEDPADREWLRRKLYFAPEATAVEIACWDVLAQAAELPLYRLLGGNGRCDQVAVAGYCFFRAPAPDGGGEVDLETMPEHAAALRKRHGFGTLKVKLGAHDPLDEAEAVRQTRHAIGGRCGLRIDPNGAWSMGTALRAIRALADLDLEYVEEPTRVLGTADHTINTAALRRIRESSAVPIAADHCYRGDLLAQIVRDDAADVVLADLYGCGGIADTLHFVRTAATFGLGVALHSGTELGIGQVAKLHLQAACRDEMRLASDAIYPEYAGDVLTGTPLTIHDGHMTVPQGPGLGVTFDDAELARWELTEARKRELDDYWAHLKGQLGVDYPNADLLMRRF